MMESELALTARRALRVRVPVTSAYSEWPACQEISYYAACLDPAAPKQVVSSLRENLPSAKASCDVETD